MPFSYKYERPAIAVDCVVFGVDDEDLKVLLIQRGGEGARGEWALPGGFVRIDESIDDAAARELVEETGLHDVYLEQLYTFGGVDRDPRERVVSVAYYALVRLSDHQAQAATDAADARWAAVRSIRMPTPGKRRSPRGSALTPLAFDHARILELARQRLRSKVRYQPIGFELLPTKFTLRQLQSLYETVLERELDKRNFRRKILSMGFLEELDELEQGVAHRAARLYRFDHGRYRRLAKEGLHFEI